jgi:hypothetical protein
MPADRKAIIALGRISHFLGTRLFVRHRAQKQRNRRVPKSERRCRVLSFACVWLDESNSESFLEGKVRENLFPGKYSREIQMEMWKWRNPSWRWLMSLMPTPCWCH